MFSPTPPALEDTLVHTIPANMFSTKVELFTEDLPIKPEPEPCQVHASDLEGQDLSWLVDSLFTNSHHSTVPACRSPGHVNNSNSEIVKLTSDSEDGREPKLPTILPGGIRHTSNPDRSLAYYYSYKAV